jgi:hypothetical protein
MIRVTSPASPRLTRTVRSLAWAEERARRVALLAGSAQIERRDGRRDEWEVLTTFTKAGSAVERRARR